jgi:AraC-like DNA-binding protein
MELPNALQQFRAILLQKLCRKQERREFVEIVLVLLVGMLWGLYNPHQVAQQLGVGPGEFYAALTSLSASGWRQLLEQLRLEQALERLQPDPAALGRDQVAPAGDAVCR